MTDEQMVDFNENFIKFLFDSAIDYNMGFNEIAGIVLARMTSIAIHSNNTHQMLMLLPEMEKTLKNSIQNDTYH